MLCITLRSVSNTQRIPNSLQYHTNYDVDLKGHHFTWEKVLLINGTKVWTHAATFTLWTKEHHRLCKMTRESDFVL